MLEGGRSAIGGRLATDHSLGGAVRARRRLGFTGPSGNPVRRAGFRAGGETFVTDDEKPDGDLEPQRAPAGWA